MKSRLSLFNQSRRERDDYVSCSFASANYGGEYFAYRQIRAFLLLDEMCYRIKPIAPRSLIIQRDYGVIAFGVAVLVHEYHETAELSMHLMRR